MIHHVTRHIPAACLDRCVEFYGLIGFRKVQTPAGIAGRAVWLEHRGTQIHLLLDERATPEPGHVGVLLDDYPGTVESLTARGVAVEPRQEHWGSPRAYVHDPAGNLVELIAFAPG
jgi:catechol 2,3-dioxygenase-like lactoylglutathione lyase family enzyme